MDEFTVRPDPENGQLSVDVEGMDHNGQPISTSVIVEKPLTLFLNSQEIVTMMTIGDYPDLLGVGFLLNQNMLNSDDEITGIEYDDELNVIVIRTDQETNFEDKLKKKVRTSGCAQGTVFGDLMEGYLSDRT